MLAAAPMAGGASGEEGLVQRRARLLLIRAPASGLEHGFDDDGIHHTHKDPEWPGSHVSVAPRCEVALRTDDPSMERCVYSGRVVSGMDARGSPPATGAAAPTPVGVPPRGHRRIHAAPGTGRVARATP